MLLSRKRGDRKDAYRVKNVEPFFLIIPYVMKTRVDSQNYFSEELDITALEQFVRTRQKEIPGLKLYHLLVAAMVRTYSQRPYLNRYVMDSKIYARKEMCVSLTIKRGMSVRDDETVIKPVFALDSTLYDVVEAFNKGVEENRKEIDENHTDFTAKLVGNLPHWLVKFVINTLWFMDKKSIMPNIINKVSPFHTSLFVTNMGSIGIKPIYHHLYEFGTTSVFVAMGKKRLELTKDSEGNVKRRRLIDIKVVTDERICNGHYYAESARMFMKYLMNPESLLTPPEKICIDNGIHKLSKRKFIEIRDGKKVKVPFELGDKYFTH